MMIGPTSFIYMSISGKSYEAAKEEVQALWKDIRRWKKLIEEVPDAEELMICPSPSVKISTYRDYLEAARDYFESQGWEYELNREEIADKEFNDRLKDVNSISIDYGGFFGGGESRTITFDKDKIIMRRNFTGTVPSREELERKYYEEMTRDELLEELANLHIGEWKKMYDNPLVLDGISWSVTFKYNDGKKKTFCGCNRYPYNFYGFLDVMQIEPLD